MTAATSRTSASPLSGYFHLGVVYIVWSSTYLAIRVAVGEGGGFPPFIMGASRTIVAGLILLAYAFWRGQRLRLSRTELRVLVLSGLFLWVGGNGLVMWAEQHANSGFAALMVASPPIWVAFANALLSRQKPSPLLIAALFCGFCGTAVLTAPSLLSGQATELSASLALMGAALCWALGSLIQTRNPINLSAAAMSGYQQLAACAGFLPLSLLLGEPLPHPSADAWIAVLYLTIFGSIFAFTSFVCTLQQLPINIAMTYAYVNPALALLLGWWLLDEPVTIWTLAGAIMVVAGVIGVFRDRFATTE